MLLSLTKTNQLHNKTLLIAIFIFAFISSTALISHNQIKGITTTMTASEIISVSNAARQSNGLAPLHPQPELMKAAEAKAEAMIAANSWSHNTPTETPWQFIQGEGYSYTIAGENLAKGFDTAEAVVNAWLNSPSHRANLLNNEYTDTGVAIIEAPYQNKKKTTLIVQFLARKYEPDSGETQSHDANQAPLLSNSIQLTKELYFLIGLSSIFIVVYITSIFKHQKHQKQPPDSAYWKR